MKQRADATHCAHGHEFTLENVYRAKSRPAYRECRTCRRDRETKRTEKARQRREALAPPKTEKPQAVIEDATARLLREFRLDGTLTLCGPMLDEVLS